MLWNTHHVDVVRRALMDESDRPYAQASEVRWVLRDQFGLRLKFRAKSGSAFAAHALASGMAWKFGLKPAAALQGDYLATSDNDQFNLAGDWAEADPAAGYMSVRIDLSDPALVAKFSTSTGELPFVAEIRAIDGDGKESTYGRWLVNVYQDVNQGGESGAAAAVPRYITVEEALALLVPRNVAGGDFRIKTAGGDVKLQKYNRTTGLYHDWGFEQVDGRTVVWIGPGEA